jgi:2'-5' RNA ligase
VRLFLAIDPGDDCRRRLAGAIAIVRSASNGIRWVRDEKLHITLAFLGEVADARVDDVRSATSKVAARHAPFSAAVSGSGVFPDWRRPRVVWFGVDDRGRMTSLGDDINAMCTSLGFPPDHPFHAHLTVGRVPHPLSSAQREQLRKALGTLSEAHPFHVTRVILMRSKLASSGSEYSEVGSFPLGGF